MNLWDFEAIDWDDEEDENGNLTHCLRHGVDERVVGDVLSGRPIQVRMKLHSAEFAVVGPDRGQYHVDDSVRQIFQARRLVATDHRLEIRYPRDTRVAENTESTMNINASTDNHNVQRSDEVTRRSEARAHRGELEPASGEVIEARNLDQMVSIRLSPDLAGSLRAIAQERGTTLSAVVREAVMIYTATQASNITCSWQVRQGAVSEKQQPMQIWQAGSLATGTKVR